MPTTSRNTGAPRLLLGAFGLVIIGPQTSALAQLDAGGEEADAGADAAAPPACASDDACPVDQYCSSASGTCNARCDDAGLCIGPPVSSSTTSLATDGAHVCYVGAPGGAGGGELGVWSWDARSDPRLLARADAVHALLIADGFCYVAGRTLTRASLTGCAEQTLHEGQAAPKRMWLGPEHVWWTVPSEAGLEIWRSARHGPAPAPEGVAIAAAEQDWEAGNTTRLFRRVRGSRACDIVSAPLDDLASESATRMTYSWSCGGELHADDVSVFFNQYAGSYQLYRIDFANPDEQIFTGMTSSEYGPVRYRVDDGWLYAQRVENPVGIRYPVTFFRSPRQEAVKEQLYAAPAGLVNFRATLFAVLGESLVFVSYREPRLAVQRVAPPPGAARRR
jgi:hypothetical protein